MKIVFWNQHFDEMTRVAAYYPRLVSSVDYPASFDRALMFDQLRYRMRSEDLHRITLVMTRDEPWAWDEIKRMGFRRAITKSDPPQNHLASEFYLPPYVPRYPVSYGGTDVISLINQWFELDPQSFDKAGTFPGLKRYGTGAHQPGFRLDWEMLASARWLLHLKHLGWGCNAPIKAVSVGVPVLCDRATLAINPVLREGHNCFVADSVQDLFEASCDLDLHAKLRENCLQDRVALTSIDPAVAARFCRWLEET